ncbi:MAG: hypothetical protein EPO12_21410 [Aquabacterium sp.]|jgi:hypothetical protein|nr:MAG: hypothetical protein EPO12_21410 [Aquabacterium sp.]
MQVEHFEIAQRFRGPPRSGNGGYVAGRVAAPLGRTAAVRLKAPPPLQTLLKLESADGQSRLLDGDKLIAEGRGTTLDLSPPPAPSLQQAEAAVPAFRGFRSHIFPGCFVCGPERAQADGLRIFPGALDGSETVAAPWTPDASLGDESGLVKPEFLWAALDCTSAFAVMDLPEGLAIVLGELAVDITGSLSVDQPCIALGWPIGAEGRKRFAGSALYTAGGQLVAVARAVWVEVPLSSWG